MTSFHHISSIGQKDNISSLEDNVKSFLDWSFLQIGGFINVNIPTSGLPPDPKFSFHILKPVNDPSQKSKVWEAPRKEWVYESGVSYSGSSPISFSGVYLNNTFLPAPTGSGSYGYKINYNLGHINFNNNISNNSSVLASYSYRYVQTYKSSDNYWWKEVQKLTYNPANFKSDGDFGITSNHRAQLPCIFIELIPRTILKPYELGTTKNIVIQDLLLHIYSENANQRNIIVDILVQQKDKTLRLYDINKVVKNNKFQLKADGSLNPGGLNYPVLVDNFYNHWCTIQNTTTIELNPLSSSLYHGVVRWSLEIFP